ncbi:hypothetical protein BCV70DRAFT_8682 [Testicularia cyperi]|uniref:Secreted protein n=1 Tax=Testicularia cyperi TaxID=1882483 RepID=A0A317XYD7_9BASI|nr:hypothetical protein BCV70DRAFT_8682 [Testicularia cyperi]
MQASTHHSAFFLFLFSCQAPILGCRPGAVRNTAHRTAALHAHPACASRRKKKNTEKKTRVPAKACLCTTSSRWSDSDYTERVSSVRPKRSSSDRLSMSDHAPSFPTSTANRSSRSDPWRRS